MSSSLKRGDLMNKYGILLCSALVATALHADRESTPTIVNRSQGRDSSHKVCALAEKVHLYDTDNYVNLAATVQFSRSFRADRLAECLFGDDLVNCNSILIQGSDVSSRHAKAWLAENFYLPPDYNGSFCIKPRIHTFVADLDLYVGLDEWLRGLYFRAYGPITWAKWNLNFDETCDMDTTGSYRAGYFDHAVMMNGHLLGTFGDYAHGLSPENTSGTTLQTDLGVAFEGLNFAKIERCSRSRTGFADLRFELGYNFFQAEDYHLGVNVQVAAPAGNRREAEFAFDPTIGNGNHWEVGAGLTGHYIFWRAQGEDKYAGVYLDANLTHINNGKEQRTFDLCGRPNSRYMLAQKLGRPVNYLRAGGTTGSAGSTTVPIAQFKGVFTPVANLTTLDVNVRASIQADVSAMFNYTSGSWGYDIGYNFWGRSKEKISVPDRANDDCCNLCNGDKDIWALKGDAHVFGFMTAASGAGLSASEPIALSATQCGANIHKGTNAAADVTDCTGIDRLQTCGIDNANFAFGRGTTSGDPDRALSHTPGQTETSDYIKTSLEPKFINCCDINFQRTRGISHKIFGDVNYTWDKDTWTPYIGIGAFVELGKKSSDDCCQTAAPDCGAACDPTACCTPCCSNVLDCAISQWALWFKGGISFH